MYTYKLSDGRLVAEGTTQGSLGELLNTEIDNYLVQYGESDEYLNMVNVVFNVFDGVDMYEVDTFMFEEATYEDNSVPVIDGGMVDISMENEDLEVIDIIDMDDNVAIIFQEYEEKVKQQQQELEQVRLQVQDCDKAKKRLSALNEEIRRIQEHVRSFKGIVEDEFFVQNIANYVGEIVDEAKKLKERIIELETRPVVQQIQQLAQKPPETPIRRSSVNMDFMTPQIQRARDEEYKVPETPQQVREQLREPQIPEIKPLEVEVTDEVVMKKPVKDIHPILKDDAKWWDGPYTELLELQIQLNDGQISDAKFKSSYGVLRQQILDSRYELEAKVPEILIDTLRIFVDYIRENGVNEQSTKLYLVELGEYIEFVLGVIKSENRGKDYVKLKRSLDTLRSHLRNLFGVKDMNEELIRLDDLVGSIERQLTELMDKGLVIGPSVVDSVKILDELYN